MDSLPVDPQPDLAAELDAILRGPEPDYDAEPEPLIGEADAERSGRYLAYWVGRIRAIDVIAENAVARIDEWHKDELAKLQPKVDFHERQLTSWHRANGGRATITLPSVVLTRRNQQDEWSYPNVEEFARWAEDYAPELVTWTPAPVKNDVKKALSLPETPPLDEIPHDYVLRLAAALTPVKGSVMLAHVNGVPVPGVCVTPQPPKYSAKPVTS